MENQQVGGGLQNSEQAHLGPLRKQLAVNTRGCSPNTQELPTVDSKRKNSSNQTKSHEGRLDNLSEGLFNHKRPRSFFKDFFFFFFFWATSYFGGLFGRGGTRFGESLGFNSARVLDPLKFVVRNDEEGEEKTQSLADEEIGEPTVFQGDSEEISDPREEHEGESWEESCLKKFSTTMGFSMKGHEKDILNLMRKIDDRRVKNIEKGYQGTSKFVRAMKNLEWNVAEREKSRKERPVMSKKFIDF